MLGFVSRLFGRKPVVLVEPAQPSITAYLKERTVADDGNSVTLHDIYTNYCGWWDEWCAEPPPTMAEFSRAMRERGIRREKLGGRVRYFDIRLR